MPGTDDAHSGEMDFTAGCPAGPVKARQAVMHAQLKQRPWRRQASASRLNLDRSFQVQSAIEILNYRNIAY